MKRKSEIAWLIVGFIIATSSGMLLVGATAGWFDNNKAVLDAEYLTDAPELIDLSIDEYERLVSEKKSFVIFVDQAGCVTADRVEGFVQDFIAEKGLKVYRMMFQDMKKTNLYEKIRFYPSVAVIGEGRLVGYLRADADADADAYNSYEAFKAWIYHYLRQKD